MVVKKMDALKGGCFKSFMVRERERQRGICQCSHVMKGLFGRSEISGTTQIKGTS